MAHLHHAHAGSAPRVELRLGAAEDGLWECGGAGCEVEDAIWGMGRWCWAVVGLGLGLLRRGAFYGEGLEGGGGGAERDCWGESRGIDAVFQKVVMVLGKKEMSLR